jgi:NADPH2:quinone reductase
MGDGAKFMLDYTRNEVLDRVLEITKGRGVAAVSDSVGVSTFETGLQALSSNGAIVSYSSTSGIAPPSRITGLSAKNLKLMRPSVFEYIQTREEYI